MSIQPAIAAFPVESAETILPPPRQLESRMAPAEVLIVDDDPEVRARLKVLLEAAGYEVRTAADGIEALESLRAQFCPLLLTDSIMPTMNGHDLCRAIRALPLDGYVYTIMLSIRDSTEDIVAGLSDGADDYISKRANRAEILARLNAGRRIAGLERLLRQRLTETRQLTNIDVHTGAYNQRHVYDALRRELQRSVRYCHSLSVLLCDVRGPAADGESEQHDRVLRLSVARIAAMLRDASDWIARWKDGCLLIVLPETALELAYETARRIQANFASEPLDIETDPNPQPLHIGVASASVPSLKKGVTVDLLLEVAEQCLRNSAVRGKLHIGTRDVIAPATQLVRVQAPSSGQH
jgi:diguanylate cyclase (GGDEF)-like protein